MSKQHAPNIDRSEVWRTFIVDCVHEIHNPQKIIYIQHYSKIIKSLYTCRSTDDILKKSCDYLQVKVCRLCKILAQVLAQIRTRSGLETGV